MGNRNSTMVIIPDRDTMITIIDHLIFLEDKLKKGERLTGVQELERKKLMHVAKAMRKVQNASVNKLGNFLIKNESRYDEYPTSSDC